MKIVYEDLALNEPSGYDPATRTVTLPTHLTPVEARVRLAVILVYMEWPELRRTAHTQLVAMRRAALRLIDRNEYHAVKATIPDRHWQAAALGVDERTLDLYDRLTAA